MIEQERQVTSSVKQCCALLYGSDAARFLLGDSFHPGGVELTLELAGLLHLDSTSFVLDVASGRGTSAFAVAEHFGCRVTGIDLSEANVAEANRESAGRGLEQRVKFTTGDAERLAFEPAAFDAILCECAFCTFPDKASAASEFARVLRPGGSIGISDLTRAADPLPDLDGLLAWVACIGDAQPLEHYASWLVDAGFEIAASGTRNDCLQQMVEQIRGKLLLADILIGFKKLAFPGLDLQQAKRFAKAAADAVRNNKLGYALLVGQKGVAQEREIYVR
ncbi:MAG: class I SAM-dependent methyltransferase [Acidobacteriaceae bacterium]